MACVECPFEKRVEIARSALVKSGEDILPRERRLNRLSEFSASLAILSKVKPECSGATDDACPNLELISDAESLIFATGSTVATTQAQLNDKVIK